MARSTKKVKREPKRRNRKQPPRVMPTGRIPIGLLPVYVRETKRVFLGCHKTQQRHEIDICVYRRCPDRDICPQYKLGRDIKEELGITLEPKVKRHRGIYKKSRKRNRKRNRKIVSVCRQRRRK